MTIDPKTLPDNTVIRVREARGETCLRGTPLYPEYVGRCSPEVVQVFVPVPDGMTVEDAQQALTEHVAWVPLPDGPTEAHVGARVLQEYAHGGGRCRREGELKSLPFPGAADVAGWKELRTVDADWFIHPDDVPDAEADLIEAMAKGMWKDDVVPWEDGSPSTRSVFRTYAERALAAMREREGGQR